MAAQHWGNCQICGREHKVSGETIATHGYTIRHGWQEGSCYGSQHKPIQLSCDLIKGAIESAKKYIEQTNKKIDKLAANPLDEHGRITIMTRRQTRSGDLIYPIAVKVEINGKGEPVALGEDGKKVKTWAFYTGIKTIEDAGRDLATKQISYFTATIEQAQESIEMMTKRLQDWKPTPLREISALEKATNAPKVHFAATKWGYKTSFCASSAMGAQRNAMARTTENREEVTCAACLKALTERDELPAKRAAEKENERQREIKFLEKEIKQFQQWIKKGDDDPMIVMRWTEQMNILTADLEKLKAEQQ